MVFVTGATGLLGGYLLLELSKRNQSIIALKRTNSNLKPIKQLFAEFSTIEQFEKIQWIEGDLLDIPFLSEALRDVQTIYHLAAYVSFDDRKRKIIREANEKATENLVNIAIDLQVPEIVYVSSIATLDKSENNDEIDENSNWNSDQNHSEYAISKKKAEMNIWRASQENIDVLIVYPSVIIGSFDGNRESEKIFQLSRNKTTYATTGSTGFVDVRDVAFAMAQLVEQKCWNQSFLLNSENKTYAEIFQFLRKKWNLPQPKIISKSQLKWIYYFTKINQIFGNKYLSKSSHQALTSTAKYQNQKIKSTININFIPVTESLSFHGTRWLKLKNIQ